jgi:hypothetical protein
MKTLTIRLPDTLVAEIELESELRRVSKSDIVRERLHQRPIAAGAGMSDLIGDILEQSWAATVAAGPPVSFAQKTEVSADHPCQKTASSIAVFKSYRRHSRQVVPFLMP